MENFEQIRSHLAAAEYQITLNEPEMACIELSFEGGQRFQSIFLAELQDDDGHKYLRINSAVAPVTGLDGRRALAFNWESRVGYLAISSLDGVPYLQLCENRPYEGLTFAEIDRVILELGGCSDTMEHDLSAGGDLL